MGYSAQAMGRFHSVGQHQTRMHRVRRSLQRGWSGFPLRKVRRSAGGCLRLA